MSTISEVSKLSLSLPPRPDLKLHFNLFLIHHKWFHKEQKLNDIPRLPSTLQWFSLIPKAKTLVYMMGKVLCVCIPAQGVSSLSTCWSTLGVFSVLECTSLSSVSFVLQIPSLIQKSFLYRSNFSVSPDYSSLPLTFCVFMELVTTFIYMSVIIYLTATLYWLRTIQWPNYKFIFTEPNIDF